MENELPPIPVINDDDLLLAVSSLATAAEFFRKAFMIVLEQSPKTPALEDFIARQGSHLQTSEAVIAHWSRQLGIDENNE